MAHRGISLLTGLLLASATAAHPLPQQPCGPARPELRVRPDPNGTPTRVSMGVFLIDLYAVDDVAQTFAADLVLWSSWTDARLDPGSLGADAQSYCTYPVAEVWHPLTMLANERAVSVDASPVVEVRAGGRCTYRQRVSGRFAFKGDLRDFPFDSQSLPIQVVVPPVAGQVVIEEDREQTGLWEEASIPNWRLTGTRMRAYTRNLPQLQADVPCFELTLDVQRYRAHYIWKLIIPLIIVVLMSWSVFWLAPKAPNKIGLGATSVLTLIAYRFATAAALPPIGYSTRLDVFLNGASLLVLGALIEGLLSDQLSDRGRAEVAHSIDRVCRVAFPLACCALLVWAFLI